MYGWIWRHLPGGTATRLLCSAVLLAVAVLILFRWVFPLAEPLLPFLDVTVEAGGHADAHLGGSAGQ